MPVSPRTRAEQQLPLLPIQNGVKFAHIPKFLGYCVGDDGSVWSCRSRWRTTDWRRLNPTVASNGYPMVDLGGTIKRVCRCVHVLLLESFVGPCPDRMEGLHWDDDPMNNVISNLRWGTRSSNLHDAYRNGRKGIGENHPYSKMTDEQVLEAISLRRDGWPYNKLAKRYGVSLACMWNALNGVTWRHLQ